MKKAIIGGLVGSLITLSSFAQDADTTRVNIAVNCAQAFVDRENKVDTLIQSALVCANNENYEVSYAAWGDKATKKVHSVFLDRLGNVEGLMSWTTYTPKKRDSPKVIDGIKLPDTYFLQETITRVIDDPFSSFFRFEMLPDLKNMSKNEMPVSITIVKTPPQGASLLSLSNYSWISEEEGWVGAHGLYTGDGKCRSANLPEVKNGFSKQGQDLASCNQILSEGLEFFRNLSPTEFSIGQKANLDFKLRSKGYLDEFDVTKPVIKVDY